MSQTRKRKRIGTGIYRDAYGLAATVKVGRLQREKRFPPDASLKTIKGWQNDARVALRKLAPAGARGTFAADAARYLEAVAAMPTIKDRRRDIDLWIAEFGPRVRYSITTAEIDTVLSRWLLAGLAPGTVNNRRTALQHLWNKLDGKEAQNPVRATEKPDLPEPEARALSYKQIQRILAKMPDMGQGVAGQARDDASKTKARLAVIAFTGLPHKLLKQLTPDMVDWRRGTVAVPRRSKGKGAKARTLVLTEPARAAMRHFADLECWGDFSNSSMLKSFHRACAAAGLSKSRPYDLRHSFATEVYRTTGDPKATAELLMHAPSSQMMDRYTQAGVAPRLRLAAKAFNAGVKAPKWLAVSAGSRSEKRKKKRESA